MGSPASDSAWYFTQGMTNRQLPPTNNSRPRYQLIPRVLCFVTAGTDVLLLKGAPNKKLWAGKYNGLGGHVERGESVQAAAAREILEESALTVSDLRLRGVITIDLGDEPGIGLFVFTAEAISRAFTASAEGALGWVPLSRVAALDTVEDLPVLLPYVLGQAAEAAPFSALYHYAADGRLIMEFTPRQEAMDR